MLTELFISDCGEDKEQSMRRCLVDGKGYLILQILIGRTNINVRVIIYLNYVWLQNNDLLHEKMNLFLKASPPRLQNSKMSQSLVHIQT